MSETTTPNPVLNSFLRITSSLLAATDKQERITYLKRLEMELGDDYAVHCIIMDIREALKSLEVL